ncbi:hypothetical protein [Candidatus Stoquefichus sp. SB1]|jgi:hypothetical protein|uniref:hypothetical protein n=1 Tax=Candidatus Stoquefichus sp. SB1 TaxID=1658109 RepID=UPI00067EF648|nr:hypothetical protein [Candidatus Stoquefichus sp. SB1]
MFNHTSYKIKISAYVFFIVNLLRTCVREINRFIELGSPSDLLMETVLGIINSIIMYFIVSLLIYAISKVIERFEILNHKEVVSKLEN